MNKRLIASALVFGLSMGAYGAPPTGADTHGAGGRIDREGLVRRHNPVIHKADALVPFSVGNGEFCFTADITGLQTFPDFYSTGIPLFIQSNWGWHTLPNPNNYKLEDVLVETDVHGRKVKLASIGDVKLEANQWLRGNPHRLGLARVGLKLEKRDGSSVDLNDCKDIEQKLDMYSGILTSRFTVEGQAVQVETCCHPTVDVIAVRIKSALISANRLAVKIGFPYGSTGGGKDTEDWHSPQAHKTAIIGKAENRTDFKRTLDNDLHYVSIAHSAGGKLSETSRHHYELSPDKSGESFEFIIAFSPDPLIAKLPNVAESQTLCKGHWKDFWNTGGAIDLSACTDPRANELERRIVMSQYLIAIQECGTLPPQESGLTFNSWYGKFHLEMHWWHGVHFALWGRLPGLERTLPWYQSVLPRVRKETKLQGYRGARWPKMIGPDGRTGPTGAVFLIWQQPHPIYYAELCYREHKDRECLEKYSDIVFESAEFMASYAWWEKDNKRYILGPPVLPAQENFNPLDTFNPTYELEYWRWGLKTAQQWRTRLGLDRDKKWDHVIKHLSKLPVKDGLYLAAESVPHTWTDSTCQRDHPSMLAACGVLPGATVDREVMSRTLDRVMKNWNWQKTWGWDFPMTAMTAARLRRPEVAIDALMMEADRNLYLPNGHNHRKGMIVYLPANGGLLSAVAMMAAGWDGAPKREAPGFPDNGKWKIRWEGLKPMP